MPRTPAPPEPKPTEPEPQAATPGRQAATPGLATVRLAAAVTEIECYVAGAGWDAPVRVFALVGTARALEIEPALAEQLAPDVVAEARADQHHLTSVEQDGLPRADDLEHLLTLLTWPDTITGAVVVVERVVLPPAAERAMPDDPDQALAYLMAHPDRQDVRLAVGVLRSGESWCAVRTRANDDDAAVAGGPDLVPGLVEAIAATLA